MDLIRHFAAACFVRTKSAKWRYLGDISSCREDESMEKLWKRVPSMAEWN
jgi:hypothetical protein